MIDRRDVGSVDGTLVVRREFPFEYAQLRGTDYDGVTTAVGELYRHLTSWKNRYPA